MVAFPASLDVLTNPNSSDTMSAVGHASQHANVNDIVEALEAKLGIGASVAATNKLLRGTGAGASAWDKDAPAGAIVGTTDAQTLTQKTLTSPTINTAIINNPTLNTNTISEFTAAAGVTIDGVLLKDGLIQTPSVNTASMVNGAVTYGKTDGTIWWQELGRTTLGATSNRMTVNFTAKRYLRVLWVGLPSGGTIGATFQFNNDTANNYAVRISIDGAADATGGSIPSFDVHGATGAFNQFGELSIANLLSSEKITYFHGESANSVGAGNIPNRRIGVSKWANTAAQINRIDLISTAGTGVFAIGSELVVLGHD